MGEQGGSRREQRRVVGEQMDETVVSAGAKRRRLSQRGVTCWPQFGESIYIYTYQLTYQCGLLAIGEVYSYRNFQHWRRLLTYYAKAGTTSTPSLSFMDNASAQNAPPPLCRKARCGRIGAIPCPSCERPPSSLRVCSKGCAESDKPRHEADCRISRERWILYGWNRAIGGSRSWSSHSWYSVAYPTRMPPSRPSRTRSNKRRTQDPTYNYFYLPASQPISRQNNYAIPISTVTRVISTLETKTWYCTLQREISS